MDNPEKYQYDNTEIQVFGGFDLESCLALSTGDKRQALKEMLGFISDNNIMHLKILLIIVCLTELLLVGSNC